MLLKLPRLLQTLTFRLALVYVGLFSLSVILLFGFIYATASNYMESQIADGIRTHYSLLLNEYHDNGSSAMEERIRELIASDDEGSEIYLLVNRENEALAGNLRAMPEHAINEGKFEQEGEWVRFYIEGARNNPGIIGVKALIVPISKWRVLLVGQSLQDKNKIEQTIIQTFWASLTVTIIMALVGAIIMTRSVMTRINVINRSAFDIMHGNLSARVPYTQGGDEFDELSQNLNEMLDKIEMLLSSISLFANNIAHDLRSPLNRIIARLEAAVREMETDAPARKLLEKNIKDMHDLVGTFNAILKISELEANTEFRNFAPCDLKGIIDIAVEFYEPLASEKDVHLVSRVSDPVPIEGEKHLLTQFFANLLDNAIKFSPKGGEIVIEADGRTLTIADQGPGVPEAYRDKVFEKFFRLEASRNMKGNGLGLSLVAAIARIHDMRLALEDNHPGLRVRIELPEEA